jgi:hypothetical protein
MKKTVMQRMLDDLLAKREVYENAKMYECVATLETSIEIAKFLLEKEKEQMLDFGLYVKKNGWVGCKIEDLYEDYNNQNK